MRVGLSVRVSIGPSHETLAFERRQPSHRHRRTERESLTSTAKIATMSAQSADALGVLSMTAAGERIYEERLIVANSESERLLLGHERPFPSARFPFALPHNDGYGMTVGSREREHRVVVLGVSLSAGPVVILPADDRALYAYDVRSLVIACNARNNRSGNTFPRRSALRSIPSQAFFDR